MKRHLIMFLMCCITVSSYAGITPPKHPDLLPPVEVSGKVTDSNGEPLPGVSIKVEGTTTGTVTSSNGTFRLSVADDGVLLFSYTGFKTQRIPVNKQTVITVKMEEEASLLHEVVAVGYGVQRKSDVTGATSTVSAKEIAKRPLVRVEQALQGTAPGVVVQSNSGQPGTGLSVRIRGANSITGSNDPLYVIDG
ncbi:MAG TPA: carboxypeptidase-like regulatory domain-containing protein, partial [Pedobacter sp.]